MTPQGEGGWRHRETTLAGGMQKAFLALGPQKAPPALKPILTGCRKSVTAWPSARLWGSPIIPPALQIVLIYCENNRLYVLEQKVVFA